MIDSLAVLKEHFRLFCDEEIGSGIGRRVFSSAVLPQSVIKCEEGAASFQNVIEWETWQRVRETPFAHWFAPCEWISPSGAVLVMARTKPPTRLPKEVPVFLTDLKKSNYGIYKGRLVCHDYGTNLLFEHGMTKRMKKADWWE